MVDGRGNRFPFTVHFKIVPERGDGKRFEAQRSRQRFANLIHTDLVENFTTGNIAEPGGGQHWGIGGDASSSSMQRNSAAVKPQFGESPSTVTVVGFYEPDPLPADPLTPYQEKQIIHSGTTHNQTSQSGPAAGAPGWEPSYEPSAANRTLVSSLKTDLEAAISSVTIETMTIELQGIKWGRGGYHFPL
jgi:hypothetical protein